MFETGKRGLNLLGLIVMCLMVSLLRGPSRRRVYQIDFHENVGCYFLRLLWSWRVGNGLRVG